MPKKAAVEYSHILLVQHPFAVMLTSNKHPKPGLLIGQIDPILAKSFSN